MLNAFAFGEQFIPRYSADGVWRSPLLVEQIPEEYLSSWYKRIFGRYQKKPKLVQKLESHLNSEGKKRRPPFSPSPVTPKVL